MFENGVLKEMSESEEEVTEAEDNFITRNFII
jgi:hypothetical protein